LNDVVAHCRQGVDCGLRNRGDEIDYIGLAARNGLRLNVGFAGRRTDAAFLMLLHPGPQHGKNSNIRYGHIVLPIRFVLGLPAFIR
jgi:hypothetical protein